MTPSSSRLLQSNPIRSVKLITPTQSTLVFRSSKKNLTTTAKTTETSPGLKLDDRDGVSENQSKPAQRINAAIQKAFQESLLFLKKDSEKLQSQINLMKSSLENQQGLSLQDELKEIERLEILSQVNDFQIRNNHHLGHQVDMSKPIYRFLEQKRWRKEGRLGRLMETVHRLRIFPDLLPSFDPQVVLKIKFQPDNLDPNSSKNDRFINIGDFVPSSRTINPPLIQVQVFHVEPKLYTIVMVDTDVPDPQNRTFTSFLHWLVPNIPFSATKNSDLGLNMELKEGESSYKIEYIGPHPAKGSGHHRYTTLIFEQPTNSPIDINDHPELVERVGFSARKLVEVFGLKPVGVLAWVSQWDPRDASSISSIYSDRLKILEPRYGLEPKPFNPRVKLPAHTSLPLNHRHPPVIPWRAKSSPDALDST